MKGTTLFGGVQIVHILITLGRSKIIAFLLGAEGMGIAALFIAPLRLITSAASLGLDQSGVREIARSSVERSNDAPLRIIATLKRLTWLTALIGAIILVIAAPLLSQWSFQSDTFVFSFMWLGLALIFNQLAASRLAILQGLQKLDFLAKSNLYGAFCGLVVTFPLYYFLGIDGILPAIIITSGFLFIFAQWFYRRLPLDLKPIQIKEAITEGKPMLKLGMSLSLSTFIGLLVAYLVQIYIGSQSGEIAVGYYSAGIVIINTYVGLIFKAMSSDYFPRLAAVSEDRTSLSKTVYEQAFVAILLITPIIVVFIAFATPLISLLYAHTFDPTVTLIRWGILGMLFKAVSWSVGYIILAKGDSKLFVKTAIGFNSVLLSLNLIGYYYGGLEGIGISLLCYFIFHFVAVQVIARMRYGFALASSFYLPFVVCLLFCMGAFGVTYIENNYTRYGLLVVLSIASFVCSYRLLDKKIGFKLLIGSIFKKKKDE